MDKYVLRPTQGKRIVQVNVNFHEVDDVAKPQPTPIGVTPFSVKPESVKITQWEHQNQSFTKPLVQKYVAKYVEYLRDQLGKNVEDWFTQVEFKFWEMDKDTVGIDDKVATGEAVPRWVRINVGANVNVSRAFEYLSAESLKSVMYWMQFQNDKLQHIVNDNFHDKRWVPVIVGGVTYNGLKYINRGLKLGEG